MNSNSKSFEVYEYEIATFAFSILLVSCFIFAFLLRIILILTFLQKGSIYDWVRYHRLHHQTFKTADDPYYSEKDFLHAQVFAHIRSLSPKQEQMLKNIDMKDLEEDQIVMFQKKYVNTLYKGCCRLQMRQKTTNTNYSLILFYLKILLDFVFNFFRIASN